MKKLLALPLLLLSCSSQIENDIRTVAFDRNDEWLKEPLFEASNFWENHGLFWFVVDKSESHDIFVTVNQLPEDRVAQCDCFLQK